MINTRTLGNRLVAMMALICLGGSPALTICSQAASAPSRAGRTVSPIYANGSRPIDGAARLSDQATQARVKRFYDERPLTFEANAGQTAARVKFVSRGDGRTVFLMPTEAALTFAERRTPDETDQGATPAAAPTSTPKASTLATQWRLKLVGANPAADMFGEDEQSGKISYLVGNDSRRWRTNLSSYGRVRCRNLYRGIDMVYYGNQQALEYDFIVAPRANPKAIVLAFDSPAPLRLDAGGDLVWDTPTGEVRHKRPYIYQEINGDRKEIAGRYQIKGKGRVAFRIDAYDKSKPLIIDPEIVYSTCIGGTKGTPYSTNYTSGVVKMDQIFGVALDPAGNAYVAGDTSSLDLPTTPGAFQTINRTVSRRLGDYSDVFIAKFDPAGRLVYSTYFGGTRFDRPRNIAVDAAGNAYVEGLTSSPDLPVTAGSFQTRCLGCSLINELNGQEMEENDSFVMKLDPTGTRLIYSTFLGFMTAYKGSIAVDSKGNAVVAGMICIGDLRIVNGFQPAHHSPPTFTPGWGYGGGANDIYVIKLNAEGSAILYSTYLGGSKQEQLEGLAMDADGMIYVAGETTSQDFPTLNGMQDTPDSIEFSSFLTKIDPEQSGAASLLYSSYIGSPSWCYGLTVDQRGGAYLLLDAQGDTAMIPLPRVTALQPPRKFPGPVVARIDTRARGALSFDFATLLSPSSAEVYTTPLDVAVDAAGNIYIAGMTQDPDFPEVNSLQVSAPFVASANGGQSFTSRPVSTSHSLQSTAQINCIAADPQNPATVYALNGGNSHLVYKSTDRGLSWSDIDFGPVTDMASTLAIDPSDSSVLYAGMRYSRYLAYKSTNGGATWTGMELPKSSGYAQVSAVVIDPQNPATVYVGAADLIEPSLGVIKSTDGGLTWQAKSNGLTQPDVIALALDPKSPSTLWVGTKSGLFKSTDGGNTFKDLGINQYVVSLAVDPRTPDTVYAALADYDIRLSSLDGRGNPRRRITIESLGKLEGLVKSTDGGASWRSINNGFAPFVPLGYGIAVDPQNPSTLYAATHDGLFKSTDGGAHWNFTGAIYSQTKAVALAAPTSDAPPVLYAGTRLLPKAFVMKLNPTGTEMLFSTGLGGNGGLGDMDIALGVAVDGDENVYVAGQTYSTNFPTKNAFQSADKVNTALHFSSGFLTRINTRNTQPPPPPPDPQPVNVVKITQVSVSGKRLLVTGANFSAGATIMLNGAEQPTANDSQSPATALSSKKAGKKVKPGKSVMVQVKNADGVMSQEFPYVRPAN